MSAARASVALVLASCATASAPQLASDAAPGGDAPAHDSSHADGATADAARPDAPTVDAPSGSCAMPMTGALAAWALAGLPGNEAAAPATQVAAGVSATPLTRSAGLTALTGSGSLNSSGWPTAAQRDPARYDTITLTPPAGCALDLASLAIDTKASGTGPTQAAVATSADAFGAATAVTPNTAATATLTVSGATSAVEIRVYGFGAGSAAGTLRIQNTLTVSGAVH